jgi:hypothetical protein
VFLIQKITDARGPLVIVSAHSALLLLAEWGGVARCHGCGYKPVPIALSLCPKPRRRRLNVRSRAAAVSVSEAASPPSPMSEANSHLSSPPCPSATSSPAVRSHVPPPLFPLVSDDRTVIPRSEIEGTKPPYVCPGCFIHMYSNNMINRFHVQ